MPEIESLVGSYSRIEFRNS